MTGGTHPVVLCILDGFGHRDGGDGNAVALAPMPALRALTAKYPSTHIAASGQPVGLPDLQVGGGEIGHLTLGAGRVVESARARIDATALSRKLLSNDAIGRMFAQCKFDSVPVHIIGLLSDGGVHSRMEHLLWLIEGYAYNGVPVIVHVILDGRDTPPRSAVTYLERLQNFIGNRNVKIGTISGRSYAMDCDDRWDRVYAAYHAIVRDKQLGGPAARADTAYDAVARSYERGQNDEFVAPVRIGDYKGIKGDYGADFGAEVKQWEWLGKDVGLAFNFRGDGMRPLTAMLTRQGVPDYVRDDLLMDRIYPVIAFPEGRFATLATYGDALTLPVAFPKQTLASTFGEVIAGRGLRQLRCAESVKRAHVTEFFSGGREAPFDKETRKLIPSPKLVDTYDQKPEMSAAKVADSVVEALERGDADFILVNFANADMLGHTGKLEAAVRALEAIDAAVGRIAAAATERQGTLVITADHGNCEMMADDGKPYTAHTANPVPFVLVDDARRGVSLRSGGSLADVAPTLLEVMGIDRPEAMTGRSLIGAKEQASDER